MEVAKILLGEETYSDIVLFHVHQAVEKLLRGGNNTAVVKVKAEVCLHCGERLYSKETINNFEQIRLKLERQDVSNFRLLGKTFQVAN